MRWSLLVLIGLAGCWVTSAEVQRKVDRYDPPVDSAADTG